jgi:dipeptidyl aminopeptidase/acylaminoacyl peptidase
MEHHLSWVRTFGGKAMRPDQLGDYRVPSDVQCHPAQDRAVFVVTTMDLVEDRYVRQLWMWNGHDVFPITEGVSDTSPRWSPDGTSLAFLTKGTDANAKPQIALRLGFDDFTFLTTFESGVSEFAWSPDGTRLVAVVSEFIDGYTDDAERERAPRRILAPSFRFDDKSWTYNVRSHLWLVDVVTGESTRLTDGDSSESSPTWSADGSTISFLGSDDPRRWLRSLNRVSTLAVETGEITERTPTGQWLWSAFNPEGSLRVLGVATDIETLELPQVHQIDEQGHLSACATVDVHILAPGTSGAAGRPIIDHDGSIVCLVENRGTVEIMRIGLDDTAAVLGGRREVTGFALRPETDEILFTFSHPKQPGALARWAGGTETVLTDLNAGFVEAAGLVVPEEFTYESDGATIHGWVYLPEGDGKVPLLLNIHGGPSAQYSWGFFDEFQIYVGAGYGVVAVNPRGSSGYGYDHVATPIGRWGDDIPPDHLDLTRAPYEAAKLFDRLDQDRMGVMGGSYGGLATVMVASMDHTYRSAVAERGVYNWVSFAGASDIPWFVELYIGATMPDGVDEIWRASSLARAHHITTPTLVIHSEHDYRCPVDQGQQLFTLLYTMGVETELLLFPPGEGHELSRSGKPKHRVERFNAIVAWHDRHLRAVS